MAERSGDGLEAYPEIGLRKTLRGSCSHLEAGSLRSVGVVEKGSCR